MNDDSSDEEPKFGRIAANLAKQRAKRGKDEAGLGSRESSLRPSPTYRLIQVKGGSTPEFCRAVVTHHTAYRAVELKKHILTCRRAHMLSV